MFFHWNLSISNFPTFYLVFYDYYRVSRNPYDTRRISGGSSSGSAAVVCAGLCPVALGVDGGGKYYFIIDASRFA